MRVEGHARDSHSPPCAAYALLSVLSDRAYFRTRYGDGCFSLPWDGAVRTSLPETDPETDTERSSPREVGEMAGEDIEIFAFKTYGQRYEVVAVAGGDDDLQDVELRCGRRARRPKLDVSRGRRASAAVDVQLRLYSSVRSAWGVSRTVAWDNARATDEHARHLTDWPSNGDHR